MDHFHYTSKYRDVDHVICNLKWNVPNEIPVFFHSGTKCSYHLIIKELPNEIKGELNCPGENTEKYKTFSIPAEK